MIWKSCRKFRDSRRTGENTFLVGASCLLFVIFFLGFLGY